MFLASSMNSARGSTGEPANKKSRSQDVSRQIDNLDYRLRQLEGDRVTFFLSAERCPGVVMQLKAAEEHYKSRAPAKGQPHPDHNKKATLMAALLNWTATQDYTQIYEATKEEAERINSVLTALRKPSLTDQLSALKTILPFYKTPLQMEREVGTCSFFSAKKDPSKLVLSFSLLPQSPSTEITTLVCFALGASGAERAPGAPPKGALFK